MKVYPVSVRPSKPEPGHPLQFREKAHVMKNKVRESTIADYQWIKQHIDAIPRLQHWEARKIFNYLTLPGLPHPLCRLIASSCAVIVLLL